VPSHLLEIWATVPQGHPTITLALKSILMVTMPRVAETFKRFIKELIYGTDSKLMNLTMQKM